MSDNPEHALAFVRQILDTTDARVLRRIGHDDRRRLADTLRAWAWAADEADRLARIEARLNPIMTKLARPPACGVLAELHDGERSA